MAHLAQAVFWLTVLAVIQWRRPEVRKAVTEWLEECRAVAQRRVACIHQTGAAVWRGVTFSPRPPKHALPASPAKERHA